MQQITKKSGRGGGRGEERRGEKKYLANGPDKYIEKKVRGQYYCFKKKTMEAEENKVLTSSQSTGLRFWIEKSTSHCDWEINSIWPILNFFSCRFEWKSPRLFSANRVRRFLSISKQSFVLYTIAARDISNYCLPGSEEEEWGWRRWYKKQEIGFLKK